MSKKIVVSELTDRELEIAWHVMCAFAEATYTFPFPCEVDGLSSDQLKIFNDGAASRHEIFEVVAELLMQQFSEHRSISRTEQAEDNNG